MVGTNRTLGNSIFRGMGFGMSLRSGQRLKTELPLRTTPKLEAHLNSRTDKESVREDSQTGTQPFVRF